LATPIDPMHQFMIQKIVELPSITVPGLGAIDLSITNSIAAMLLSAFLIITFYTFAGKGAVVPGRLQTVGEMLYGIADGLTSSIIGHDGKKYLPFVFTLFAFVLFANLQGMLFGWTGNFLGFTSTSQLAVTLTLGMLVILTVITVGVAKNGFKFFKLFAPSGVPVAALHHPGADRDHLVPDPPDHPGASSVRQHAGRPRGAEDLRDLRGHPAGHGPGLLAGGPAVADLRRRPDGPRVHGGLPSGLRVRGAHLRLSERRRAPRQPLINL
jgi:hypothetical protein